MPLLPLLLLACRPADDGGSGDGSVDDTSAADTGDSSGDSSGANGGDSGDNGGDTGPLNPCPGADAPDLDTTTWRTAGEMPASNFSSVVGVSGGPIYLASMLTGLWRSDDGGDRWDALRTTTTHVLSDLSVDPSDPDTVYFSAGGLSARTQDGGQSFEMLPLGSIMLPDIVEVFALVVSPYDSDRILAVTSGGDAYLSTDRAASFTKTASMYIDPSHSPSPSSMDLYWRLLPDPAPGGTAVFTDGYSLWTSTDSSLTSWVPSFTSPVESRSLVRDPNDPDHLLIGAADGLYVSDDGGLSFVALDRDIRPIVGAWSPDGQDVAFASMDDVWFSSDAGRTFTERPIDFMAMPAMAFLDDGLFLGWNDGMKRSTDDAQTWDEISDGLTDGGVSVISTDPTCPGRLITGSRCSGGIYHSDDFGETYVHDPHFFHYVMGVTYDLDDPNVVWTISDENIAKSVDGGQTWTYVWTKYHFHGFAIDPDDHDTVLVGSVGSGSYADTEANVYRSTDGGRTWTKTSTGLPASQSSAHAILHWPGNPDVVLLGTYKAGDESHQTGDGIGLYRSTDRGDSWSLTSLPAIDIAWLALCPDGVMAGTEDGLWHSSDEGVTWERYDGVDGQIVSAVFDGDLGLALEIHNHVFRTDDGGLSWYPFESGLGFTPDVDSTLATIAIDASGTVAWLSDYPIGVYRIGL